MMSLDDLAAEQSEMLREYALKHNRRKVDNIKPNGSCHNSLCCDDVEDGKLFCNSKCAEEYERLKIVKS